MAVAMDYVNQTFAVYIDGHPVTASITPTPIPTDWTPEGIYNVGRPDRIGGRFVNIDEFFHGALDEVEIYSRALSQAEIHAIFNAGAAGTCKP